MAGEEREKENEKDKDKTTLRLRHRWSLDFSDDTTNVTKSSQPQRPQSVKHVIDTYLHPPGFATNDSPKQFSPNEDEEEQNKQQQQHHQKDKTKSVAEERAKAQNAYKESWIVAFAPVRGFFTSSFALYVSGTRLQAFSLLSTITVLFVQLRALFSIRDAFRRILKSYPLPFISIVPQIIVHLAVCLLGVGFALFKAHVLGFLPTTESDWIALLPLHSISPSTYRHATSI